MAGDETIDVITGSSCSSALDNPANRKFVQTVCTECTDEPGPGLCAASGYSRECSPERNLE